MAAVSGGVIVVLVGLCSSGMPVVSVASYSIEVREFRGTEAKYLKFEKGGAGASVYKAVLSTLKVLKKPKASDETKELLKVALIKDDNPDIRGIVRRGAFGLSAPIYSKKTLSKTHHQRTEEAGLLPFYFRFHLPDGATKGLLLIQRAGVHGAYTGFKAALSDSFNELHKEHRLVFKRVVTAETLKQVMESPVQGYEVVTYSPPSDITDFLRHGAKTNKGTIKIRIDAPSGESLWPDGNPAWYRRIVSGSATVAQIWGDDSEIASLNVRTKFQGKPWTFDLTDPEDILPYTPLPDVKMKKNGHADFDSIDTACNDICEELKKKFGLAENG